MSTEGKKEWTRVHTPLIEVCAKPISDGRTQKSSYLRVMCVQ